ncbi:hypothetical protein F5Y16DRAFT_380766 [Xylariaceae sp. FL0255]|nr:hypothetical protein F5Y16DRAFT_380766 [Xylariaceae sp. FL0255]
MGWFKHLFERAESNPQGKARGMHRHRFYLTSDQSEIVNFWILLCKLTYEQLRAIAITKLCFGAGGVSSQLAAYTKARMDLLERTGFVHPFVNYSRLLYRAVGGKDLVDFIQRHYPTSRLAFFDIWIDHSVSAKEDNYTRLYDASNVRVDYYVSLDALYKLASDVEYLEQSNDWSTLYQFQQFWNARSQDTTIRYHILVNPSELDFVDKHRAYKPVAFDPNNWDYFDDQQRKMKCVSVWLEEWYKRVERENKLPSSNIRGEQRHFFVRYDGSDEGSSISPSEKLVSNPVGLAAQFEVNGNLENSSHIQGKSRDKHDETAPLTLPGPNNDLEHRLPRLNTRSKTF